MTISNIELTEKACFGFSDVQTNFLSNPVFPHNVVELSEIHIKLLVHWAFLVAQLVKNLPAMWETWVQPLGWEDLLEKGMAYPLHPGEFHGLYGPWVAESQTRLSNFHFTLEHYLVHISTQYFCCCSFYFFFNF